MYRLLKARQPALNPLRQQRDIRARLAFHYRHRTLPILGIIQRNDKRLAYLRMRGDNALQRFGLDPFSAAEKEIVHSAQNGQASVMPLAAIAGGEPALLIDQRQ